MLCTGYTSSCRATLVPDTYVLQLSQRPFGRVSGLGRSARPCLRKQPLPKSNTNTSITVGLYYFWKRDQTHNVSAQLLYDTSQRSCLPIFRSNGLES